MSEPGKLNHDDLLDRAARALAETHVPEGPPQAIIESLLAAAEVPDAAAVANAPEPSTFKRRIFTMKSITRMAVAATVFLALGLGLFWFFADGSSTPAFADAADALLKARTVTCRVRIHGKMKMTVPMDVSKMNADLAKILPKGVKPKQRRKLPKGKVTTTTETTFTSAGKLLFLAPSWQRMETEKTGGESVVTITSDGKILHTEKMPPMPGNAQKTIQIFDTARSESLALDPAQKMAVLTRWENMPSDSRNQTNLFFNLRTVIEQARSGKNNVKVQSLGEKTIEGRAAVGYALRQDVLGVKWEFWFDPTTAETVRMELAMGTASGGAMEMTAVMDHVRTDVELDESLFSLEVPKGYKTQTFTVDASQPTIADLGKMLRDLASRNKNVFPDKLPKPGDAMKLIMEESTDRSMKLAAEAAARRAKADAQRRAEGKPPAKEDERPAEKPPEIPPAEVQAMAQRAMTLSRGLQFLATTVMLPGTDWHYAGKGVKLNAPGVPIFWYKPTGSETYQVLYADLTVKELPKDQLPPQAEPRP